IQYKDEDDQSEFIDFTSIEETDDSNPWERSSSIIDHSQGSARAESARCARLDSPQTS
ncbi:hypothetical protein F5887DRAFT_1283215, partial [Amanita rubescens]